MMSPGSASQGRAWAEARPRTDDPGGERAGEEEPSEVPTVPGDNEAVEMRMPRVVLVDDDSFLRGELRGLLEDFGFEILGEAVEGREAVRLASMLRPDVLLMDLRMPLMDGIEAARRIASLKLPTKVVMLSAYNDPALGKEATRAGVYAYLVKGCSPDVIRDVILAASRFD